MAKKITPGTGQANKASIQSSPVLPAVEDPGSIALSFVRADGLSSAAIAYFGGGRWSHCDALLKDGRYLGARDDAIQLPDGSWISSGVRVRPPDYTPWVDQEVWRLPCTLAQQLAFEDFLHAQVGKPYDSRAILGFVAGQDWRNPGAWFCAELLAAGLEKALGITFNLGTNKITPNALYLAVGAMGAIQVIL